MGADFAQNSTASVGTTASTVLQACQLGQRRKVLHFKNTSTTQNITISYGIGAVKAGSGIVLSPGGTITESDSENYDCWQGEIQAISDAAGGTLAIHSKIRWY